MSPQTFIFIGRSGCGKGTQAELLMNVLKEKDSNGEISYIETGQNFRDFIKGDGYSNKLSNEIYKSGERQPDFLAIWMWAHVLIERLRGNEHLIFDGITRSLGEAMSFTTALNFYKREAVVVYLEVSREWSEERMKERGRSDDRKEDEVRKRLNWFDTDTAPAIGYFKTNDKYKVLYINGEQSIEDVHKEILSKLGW